MVTEVTVFRSSPQIEGRGKTPVERYRPLNAGSFCVWNIDFGSASAGEDTEFSCTTACSYYKLTINGETLIEIDLVNMVENIGGVDRLAEQRRAIGVA